MKSKFDSEHVEKTGFVMGINCFFGTIKSVINSKGVVERDNDEMKKIKEQHEKEMVSK